MDATTTTTIRGVSIFSRQRKRKADVFDIALSSEGIAVQRPGRSDQHMAWERISQWELEERPDCVVLTLRGGGSVTPLMVKGWTLEDLERVMRETTEGSPGPTEPVVAAEPVVPEPSVVVEPVVVAEAVVVAEPVAAEPEPVHPPLQPRAARRRATREGRSAWRAVATVVVLGVVAAAVVLVLLQSAGAISWGFLGPTA